MDPTDADLMAAITRGDQVAFDQFFARHYRKTVNILIRLLREPGYAEDVAQEAFLQLWTRAGQYDAEKASPGAWLTMIARSRGMDLLRKRKPDSGDGYDPAFEADPTLMLIRDESRQKVRDALSQLPAEQRKAVSLAFLGGLTHEQIALSLGVPLGTVKTRIRLAMRRLREMLPDEA